MALFPHQHASQLMNRMVPPCAPGTYHAVASLSDCWRVPSGCRTLTNSMVPLEPHSARMRVSSDAEPPPASPRKVKFCIRNVPPLLSTSVWFGRLTRFSVTWPSPTSSASVENVLPCSPEPSQSYDP